MPKKIKEKKETLLKGNSEPLLNVNNVHTFFGIIGVIALIIIVCVGLFVYLEDKYHVHKDNAIVLFQYNETLEEGYNNFQIAETNTKQIATEFVSMDIQDVGHMSRKKWLDFNEEIYRTGIMDNMLDGEAIVTNNDWSLYIKLADGTRKYLYSAAISETNNEEQGSKISQVREIVTKYLKHDTLYK